MVLPHPLGPVSSMNSPGFIEMLISSIAGFEAFGYEYVKFFTSTIPKAAISPIVDIEPSHNIIVSPIVLHTLLVLYGKSSISVESILR